MRAHKGSTYLSSFLEGEEEKTQLLTTGYFSCQLPSYNIIRATMDGDSSALPLLFCGALAAGVALVQWDLMKRRGKPSTRPMPRRIVLIRHGESMGNFTTKDKAVRNLPCVSRCSSCWHLTLLLVNKRSLEYLNMSADPPRPFASGRSA